MKNRKLIIRTPRKCPFCGADKTTKKSIVTEHQQPNGLQSYIYRAVCKACHETYCLREVYEEAE